jgi:hypothetical protein
MDVYQEYGIIDKHIELSSDLHILNITGKQLIQEIQRKKHIRQKRSGNYVFSQEVQCILNAIVDVTNTKRFNKLRLYFCIQYYLDELLFKSIKKLETFHIEDEVYKLTDLYFNQQTWNCMTMDDLPKKSLSEEKFMTSDDSQTISQFINSYTEFLDKVFVYLDTLQDIDYIRKKLKRISNRIKAKFSLPLQYIHRSIEEDIH